MIGRDQVLAAILDPLDRMLESQRGSADEKVFGIDFAPDPEAAANVAFIELNGFFFPRQHLGDRIAIPVWHLGCAMQLQNIACLVVAGDGTACFERHAGMAPYGKVKRDSSVGIAKGAI